jgi:prepilin signal peptidase PulO-like enzyme (type II secretory pathway)
MLTVFVPAPESRLRETLPAGTAIVGALSFDPEIVRVHYGRRNHSSVTETYAGRVVAAVAYHDFDSQGAGMGDTVPASQLIPVAHWNKKEMRLIVENAVALARWLGVDTISERELQFEIPSDKQTIAFRPRGSSDDLDSRIQELEALSHQPDKWAALDDAQLSELTWYNVARYRGDVTRIPIVDAVYEVYAVRISYDERKNFLLAVVEGIGNEASVVDNLLPFIMKETAWNLVSTAVLEMAQRMPLENNDPMTGIKFFRKFVEINRSFEEERHAAILSGLLLLGDRRAVPILRGSWRLLGQEGRMSLSRSFSGFVYAGVIDFFLDWLEDSSEGDFGKIAAALVRMPFTAAHQAVIDIERSFPISKDSTTYRLVGEWSFQEYGRIIEPRLRDLLRRESEPKVLPLVMEAWDIERIGDRKLTLEEIFALSRGQAASPISTRRGAEAPGQPESRPATDQGVVSLKTLTFGRASPCFPLLGALVSTAIPTLLLLAKHHVIPAAATTGFFFGFSGNVLIDRIPLGLPLNRPPSYSCSRCGNLLPWWGNIPVFGRVFVYQRCHNCASTLSSRYFLVEVLIGGLFGFCALRHGLSWNGLACATLGFLLVTVLMINHVHMIMPNKLVYPGVVLGLALSLARGGAIALEGSLVSAAVSVAIVLLPMLITRSEIRAGRLKLATMIGVFVGWPATIAYLLLAIIVVAIWNLIMAVLSPSLRGSPARFGWAMGIGGLVAMEAGLDILHQLLRALGR